MLPILATRRQIITLGAAAAVHFVNLLARACLEPLGQQLDWEGFVEQLSRLAEDYGRGLLSEQTYIDRVCRLLPTLNYRTDSVNDQLRIHLRDIIPSGLVGLPLKEERSFEVALFSFEKGQYFTYHDHPSMAGACMCLTGEIEIHNLDFIGHSDPATFLLRDRGTKICRAGDVSWLTSRVRNVHRVMAKNKAQLLDVFTPPYDATRVSDTRWYELEPKRGKDGELRAHLL